MKSICSPPASCLGTGPQVTEEYDRDLGPDGTDTVEQKNNNLYIKWDDNTHEMRPDYTYQRDPVQGPYVHNDLNGQALERLTLVT